ncbi:hypothetical protein E2C01_049116 [Portunus trituberculatus]|uniref:Uncharacterized protein n=1 Tax=Portunus trituberculatus TaxID=210409 RepID=A0A5B7GCT7_PORTR|nr:hypothetical protein [Portunus trituberculatus]
MGRKEEGEERKRFLLTKIQVSGATDGNLFAVSSYHNLYQQTVGGVLFGVPPISKPTHKEIVAPSEEAQPTPGPWTGFEPLRLETPRTPKQAWFHSTLCPTSTKQVT